MNNDKILTELVLSVMAIQGKFRNLFLNEYLVDFYRPKGNVLCIESNCGKNVHPDYNYIKTKNKKLIYNDEPETWEFYDLEKDPGEENNIYDKDSDIVNDLKEQLLKHFKENNINTKISLN